MNYNHCAHCKSRPCSCPIDHKSHNKIENNPSITNTFKPTIHVHPIVSPSNDHIGESHVVESAFRANKNGNQSYPVPEEVVGVTFEVDQFDFDNEYSNPIFTPNQEGVYTISAGVGFDSGSEMDNYDAVLTLVVNNQIVATDFLHNVRGIQSLNLSTIEGLNAGDRVGILLEASVSGFIIPIFNVAFFAAARFPFEGFVPPISSTSTTARDSSTSLLTLLKDHEAKRREVPEKKTDNHTKK